MADFDYLVIAAHPDDAELSLGGTILLLKAEGAAVGVLDLTDGEPTPHGTVEKRRQESAAATAALGIDWRANLGMGNRTLQPGLQARGLVAGVIRDLRPRVLFVPYWEDSHPDHLAASELADAARFWAKLTKTELPGEPHYPSRVLYYLSYHLRQTVKPSLVVDVSPYHETKMKALACYHSQFIEGRPSAFPTFLDDVRGRDRYWGWTIGAAYAEPFLCREQVGLRSLRDLS